MYINFRGYIDMRHCVGPECTLIANCGLLVVEITMRLIGASCRLRRTQPWRYPNEHGFGPSARYAVICRPPPR